MKHFATLSAAAAVSCLLALSLASCDSGPISPASTRYLIPLNEGNRWTYREESYYGETTITHTYRAEIVDEVLVRYEGERYRAAAYNPFHPDTNEPADHQWIYWNGPGGVYSLGGRSNTDTLLVKRPLWKYPAQEGDTFRASSLSYNSYVGEFSIEDTLAYTVTDTDARFETPAGTFRCYVYHSRRHPAPDIAAFWNYYTYIAPGIGHVGQVVKKDSGYLMSKDVLTDYRIQH